MFFLDLAMPPDIAAGLVRDIYNVFAYWPWTTSRSVARETG